MEEEIPTVLLYVAFFGFSEIIIQFFNIKSFKSKLSYYLFVLAVSLFIFANQL